jgi:hypothetical protein
MNISKKLVIIGTILLALSTLFITISQTYTNSSIEKLINQGNNLVIGNSLKEYDTLNQNIILLGELYNLQILNANYFCNLAIFSSIKGKEKESNYYFQKCLEEPKENKIEEGIKKGYNNSAIINKKILENLERYNLTLTEVNKNRIFSQIFFLLGILIFMIGVFFLLFSINIE